MIRVEHLDFKLPCDIYPLPLLEKAIKGYESYCDVQVLESCMAWTLVRVIPHHPPIGDPHQDLVAEFLNYALDLAATEQLPGLAT